MVSWWVRAVLLQGASLNHTKDISLHSSCGLEKIGEHKEYWPYVMCWLPRYKGNTEQWSYDTANSGSEGSRIFLTDVIKHFHAKQSIFIVYIFEFKCFYTINFWRAFQNQLNSNSKNRLHCRKETWYRNANQCKTGLIMQSCFNHSVPHISSFQVAVRHNVERDKTLSVHN